MAGLDATVPKALVPIGDRPVLWHIMQLYAAYGHTSFVLALGWLGDAIKAFVADGVADDWRIECLDTGTETLKGTRLRRAIDHLEVDRVMVTYGDGIADVDISALLEFHERHGRLATITAVHPPSRFGEVALDETGRVTQFHEKPPAADRLINGGFMVFERAAIHDYIDADADVDLERDMLTRLSVDGELMAFTHHGFWHCLDTPKELAYLNEVWAAGEAPWKVWN